MSINLVQVTTKGNRIEVEAPYSRHFVYEAKWLGLNHKWQNQRWSFDASGAQKVRALIIETYGMSDSQNQGRLTLITDGVSEFFNHQPQGARGLFDEAYSPRLERLAAEEQYGRAGSGL